MTLNRRLLIVLGTLGSVGLILGALAFQYIGGMPPCKLCYWQRYGHALAIAAGVAALVLPARLVALIGAAGAGGSAAVGLYHTGVERGWWEGPTSCTSGSISGLTPEELMAQIMNAPLVRCDDVAWSMLGLSMASWNAIASAVLCGLWLAAALRRT